MIRVICEVVDDLPDEHHKALQIFSLCDQIKFIVANDALEKVFPFEYGYLG